MAGYRFYGVLGDSPTAAISRLVRGGVQRSGVRRRFTAAVFQGAYVGLDGFAPIGQRGILRFALGDAAGQAGALGDPRAIFPAIDGDLPQAFLSPASERARAK